MFRSTSGPKPPDYYRFQQHFQGKRTQFKSKHQSLTTLTHNRLPCRHGLDKIVEQESQYINGQLT